MSEESDARAVPGRTARRMADTRKRLLESAMRLFTGRSIDLTRIEDITEEADVAKGAFYNYFESKEALVAELLSEGIDLLDQNYLATVPAASSDVHAFVAALAERHDAFLADQPGYSLLLHQARGLMLVQERRVEPLREVILKYLTTIAARLVPAAAGATPPPERVLELACAFAGTLEGQRSFARAAGITLIPGASRDLASGGLAELLRRYLESSGSQ